MSPSLPKKFNGIRSVVFDLDGTMVDSVPDIHLALNLMKADFNFPEISIEQVRRFVGRGTEKLVRDVLSMEVSPSHLEKILSGALTSFYRHYRKTNGCYSAVYPGVKEGLSLLKEKGIKLACVTNKPAIFTEPLLAKKGLYSFFHFISSADTFPLKKPHPLPIQMVCLKFDVTPLQTLVIGDSINDGKAAREAGCSLFIVPYGYNHGQPIQEIDSDGIIPDILTAAKLII